MAFSVFSLHHSAPLPPSSNTYRYLKQVDFLILIHDIYLDIYSVRCTSMCQAMASDKVRVKAALLLESHAYETSGRVV